MQVTDQIRKINALLAKTVAHGCYPDEAAKAQALAHRLIADHKLEAFFPTARPAVAEPPRNLTKEAEWKAYVRRHEAQRAEQQRQQEQWRDEWARETAERRRAGARKAAATRRANVRAARRKEYAGNAGTARAVTELNRKVRHGVRYMPVTEAAFADWMGLTANAAHGRLWRAWKAGVIHKVDDGYI